MMATVYIYGMRCPVKDEIMYVGASLDIEKRKGQHLHEALSGGKSLKCTWLRHLVNDGWRPVMEVIEECTEDNWRERELFWIEHHRAFNPELTNSHDCVKPRAKKLIKFSHRFDFFMRKEDIAKLHALADANTSGNVSEFVRQLIDRSYISPHKVGLNPPKKEGDK